MHGKNEVSVVLRTKGTRLSRNAHRKGAVIAFMFQLVTVVSKNGAIRLLYPKNPHPLRIRSADGM